MVMSTPVLEQAAAQLATVLIDSLQIMDVGERVTTGIHVTRQLTPVGQPIVGLVQTTTLANAAESRVVNTYSVKVPQGTALRAGQAVKVLNNRMDPSLIGRVLLVEKVSENGAALIRKAVATDFQTVNTEGKGVLGA